TIQSPTTFAFTTANDDGSDPRKATATWGGYINAYGVEIHYRSTSSPSTASPTSASDTTFRINPAANGLPTGAKAGIGVAAVIFVLAVLLALWCRRKRRKRPEQLLPEAGHQHPLRLGKDRRRIAAAAVEQAMEKEKSELSSVKVLMPHELTASTVDSRRAARQRSTSGLGVMPDREIR
ncbi:hypothetical protein LTS18_009125, partial [Coniosporium uncinatum]